MNKIDRFKILIRAMRQAGFIVSQKDLGQKLGYANESYFSQIVNEKAEMPKDFMSKLEELYPIINTDWILNGEGNMFKDSINSLQSAEHSIQQNANGKNITQTVEDLNTSRFLTLLEKKDEQMDRLLTIIESLSK